MQTWTSQVQKIAFALFLFSIVLFFFVLRRAGHSKPWPRGGFTACRPATHSRSKLPNLRMLNAKLSNSLEQTSQTFEPAGRWVNWFAGHWMTVCASWWFDLPFLRNMYTQNGYKAGLELEDWFGEVPQVETGRSISRLPLLGCPPALYRTEFRSWFIAWSLLCSKGKFNLGWIEFETERNINRTVRMGIADYPFLPRVHCD